MHGLHLTADLRDCPVHRDVMTEPENLRETCMDAVHAAGLRPVGELFHRFVRAQGPAGVTGVVLLAESHVAVHTWPELGGVTLDVYVCNVGGDNSARAHALLARLIAAFAPGTVERHELQRGALTARAERRAAPKPARAPSGGRTTYSSSGGRRS